MAQNMPRFAAASGAADAAWGEVDNFDVDVLADYLLSDSKLSAESSGVVFDFNMDGNEPNSTVISPENSVDGQEAALPTVEPVPSAAAAAAPTQPNINAPVPVPQQAAPQQQQQQFSQAAGAPSYSMPPAPVNGNNQALLMQQQRLEQQQANKRQRVEQPQLQQQQRAPPLGIPMIAVAGGISTQLVQPEMGAGGRARKKSQAQIDRRRERNRILARRTRLRKKFFFESLQKEVMDLQRENEKLKSVVRGSIQDQTAAKTILADCDAAAKLPAGVLEACGENASLLDSQDFNLVNSIQSSQHSFVITDPSLPDNPIVFASDDFLSLTGYSREQVLGRNCRFLQGPDTSTDKVEMIRKALASGEDVTVTIKNFTADGKPFWNKLFIAALRDAQNNIVNFIGVIVKVNAPEPGDPEHDKAQNERDDDDDDDDDVGDDE